MSILERIFSKQKPPAAPPRALRSIGAGVRHVPAEYKAAVGELTAIGKSDGFLAFKPGGRFNDQCRHIRAREIGIQLNTQGGSSLMRKIYDRVDCPNVRQLAAAWDGIGDWAG